MKIPATIVTGFLGAGKTTLIRHLLRQSEGKRIALIINEFGDLGMDREILQGCGIEGCREDDVVELANGCICCTVADDFLPTMEMLLDRDETPDHIIIETSGLALPKPLIKAFTWPEIKARVTVDGVVAVIDAPAVAAGRFADDPDAVRARREDDERLDHHSPLEEVFGDQLLSADLVLMNKADLADDAQRAAARETIERQAPKGARIVETVNSAADPRLVLGMGMAVEELLDNRKSRHDGHDGHGHDDFETFILRLPDPDDPKAVGQRLGEIAETQGVLRFKGVLNVPGKPRRHVIQGVGPRIDGYYDRVWRADETRESRLVVIGLHGVDKAAVASALNADRIDLTPLEKAS